MWVWFQYRRLTKKQSSTRLFLESCERTNADITNRYGLTITKPPYIRQSTSNSWSSLRYKPTAFLNHNHMLVVLAGQIGLEHENVTESCQQREISLQ